MASAENGEAGWFPDPEDATGKWLRYWDGEDWIDVPPRLASNRERERYVWPAAPSPKTLDQEGEVGLAGLLLLGGHGFPLFAESRYDLHFGPDAVLIEGPGPEGVTTTTIRYSDLTNLSIEGPGKVREGGGFVGGGVGIEGFFIGAAAAGVLNSLTTRTRVETLIGLQAGAHELIFLCTAIEPSALSLRLSRLRGLLRTTDSDGRDSGDDPATQLSKLADLVERGFLEREEYETLKRRLLERLQ
jgi:hypothetical protein